MTYNRIGTIYNYYGGLYVAHHEDKYYWLIENYDTNLEDIEDEGWQEIPKNVYDVLIAFDINNENEFNKLLYKQH